MEQSEDTAASAAVAKIENLLADPAQFGELFEKVELGDWDWASVHVYLPQPDIQSAITPPFMEAYLVLQKQLYQLAALAKTGLADVGQLGERFLKGASFNTGLITHAFLGLSYEPGKGCPVFELELVRA